ncbi:MAG: RHS repeat protein, partial [candidate division Zixibacteria bacterium]|nr:RHS repeat protein [candidate division Zixibacteria bacterium]
MVRQTDPLGFFKTMAYDLNRNLIAVTDEEGRVTRFEYDAANRQTAVIGPDPQVLGGPDGPRTDMDYDAAGRVIAR